MAPNPENLLKRAMPGWLGYEQEAQLVQEQQEAAKATGEVCYGPHLLVDDFDEELIYSD